MKHFAIHYLLFFTALLMSLVASSGRAGAQTGGQAFSAPVTAGQGHKTISVSSTKDISIEEVLHYDEADAMWKPVEDWEQAITPTTPAKNISIDFVNGLSPIGSTGSSTLGAAPRHRALS